MTSPSAPDATREAGSVTKAAEIDLSSVNAGIVHDWFPVLGGGERVVQELVNTLPNSSIYGLFDFLGVEDRREIVGSRNIKTSRLNRLPLVERYYRYLLLNCTRAIEEFDLSSHDVVVTSSAALAKGVLTVPGQFHLAYVHSPARYAWDLAHEYVGSIGGPLGGVKRAIAREIMHRFRIWDMRTPASVDLMVANSNFIRARIRKVYGRDAKVVYPPVRTDQFTIGKGHRDNTFLAASRLVPYKRIDIVVEAFRHMPHKRLVVIGDGPEMGRIKQLAGPNVEILGYQPFDVLRTHMQTAKAFVFLAKEDFGIMPVEAQACGTPVIALGVGGTAETVQGLGSARPTGVHIREQTVGALVEAITSFENNQHLFDAEAVRANALYFGATRFRDEIGKLIVAHGRTGSDVSPR